MTVHSGNDEALRKKIDALPLSERLARLKDAMLSAPRIVSVDRAKLAMESWKETEGEDIELRRAKLFRKVLERAPIAIHDFDIVVGRETEHLVGAPAFVDQTGDSIQGLLDEGQSLGRGMLFRETALEEDKNTLRECARFFAGKTAPDHVTEAWSSVVGTWAQEISEAKGSDPTPDSGYYPGVTCRGMWEKVLSGGMRGLIEEAEAGIRRFKEMRETDVNKLHFWQSAIIVCEAMTQYARRYAELARRKAGEESNPERRDELMKLFNA
jgi:formate C-acetyltransferase